MFFQLYKCCVRNPNTTQLSNFPSGLRGSQFEQLLLLSVKILPIWLFVLQKWIILHIMLFVAILMYALLFKFIEFSHTIKWVKQVKAPGDICNNPQMNITVPWVRAYFITTRNHQKHHSNQHSTLAIPLKLLLTHIYFVRILKALFE